MNELKTQLESLQSVSRLSDAASGLETPLLGAASAASSASTRRADDKHRDQLRRVERDRKDAQEVRGRLVLVPQTTWRRFRFLCHGPIKTCSIFAENGERVESAGR